MAVSDMRRQRERNPLTETAIVATALDLARTQGLPALTMRRIAQELQTSPMSLYRHIPDRDGLLIRMLDDVAQRILLPPTVEDPRDELEAIAKVMRCTFARDPWVILLLTTEGLASPFILPLVDRAFTALYRAGHSGRSATQAWARLFQFVYGEALATQMEANRSPAVHLFRENGPDSFPGLRRMVAENAMLPAQPNEDFAVNLAYLLDTIVK